MRKCLYGILASVFLCMQKAEKTDANKEYAKYFEPFVLYNDADWLYNIFNNSDNQQSFLKNAEDYLKYYPFNLVVSRDEMIKQHIYISALRYEPSHAKPEHVRALTMLNFFLTLEAYEAAVIFRVCAFFYSSVINDVEKCNACMHLSLHMEWYFFFMLEEKAEDLCAVKKYFPKEENTFSGGLKAENVCEIFKKLNLDFLRFPQDPMYVYPLHDDDNNNVYNPKKLTVYDSEGDGYFRSIFQNYKIPPMRKNQSLDNYVEMVYYDLWSSVMAAYTDKYFELFHYMFEVTKGVPHQRSNTLSISTLQFNRFLWDHAPQLSLITTLPEDIPRGVVSYFKDGKIESSIGSVIYRSNAVEILRQKSYHFVLSKLNNAGLKVLNIMNIINSSNPKCHVDLAPKELSVDYVFHINTEDIMPLL